jgi:hypothetical protein
VTHFVAIFFFARSDADHKKNAGRPTLAWQQANLTTPVDDTGTQIVMTGWRSDVEDLKKARPEASAVYPVKTGGASHL